MYKTKITKWDDYKQEPLKRIENQRKDIQYSKFSVRLNIYLAYQAQRQIEGRIVS